MDEISNKTLAILLIGAIVISLGGTLISLNKLTNVKIPGITGFAVNESTEGADIELQISSLVKVWWSIPNINWGTGGVNTSTIGCTLQSFAPSIGGNCTGFDEQLLGLVLVNTGTVDASLKIMTGKDAVGFIGGGNDSNPPVYQWKAADYFGEAGSCTNSTGFNLDQFYDAETGIARDVCSNFTMNNSHDAIQFDVKVWIPNDAPADLKYDTITATATAI